MVESLPTIYQTSKIPTTLEIFIIIPHISAVLTSLRKFSFHKWRLLKKTPLIKRQRTRGHVIPSFICYIDRVKVVVRVFVMWERHTGWLGSKTACFRNHSDLSDHTIFFNHWSRFFFYMNLIFNSFL